MSEPTIVWMFGTLIAALFGLIAFLGRMFWAKLEALEEGQRDSLVTAHIARFNATEQAWDLWRASLEADRKSRHDEHGRRLDSHAAELKSHENRITRLERNGH
jgi:hypothetical protein